MAMNITSLVELLIERIAMIVSIYSLYIGIFILVYQPKIESMNKQNHKFQEKKAYQMSW